MDDFRAIKPDAPDSGRKSNRSFAEEVEREIQEFKAKQSKASDANGVQQRGRPRESEIDKISVTQRKRESPARGTSYGSLGKGSAVNN
jgi:hypothetical protein